MTRRVHRRVIPGPAGFEMDRHQSDFTSGAAFPDWIGAGTRERNHDLL